MMTGGAPNPALSAMRSIVDPQHVLVLAQQDPPDLRAARAARQAAYRGARPREPARYHFVFSEAGRASDDGAVKGRRPAHISEFRRAGVASLTVHNHSRRS